MTKEKKMNIDECISKLKLLEGFWYLYIPYGSWASDIKVKYRLKPEQDEMSKIVEDLYPNIYFNEADAYAAKKRIEKAF